MPLLYPDEVNQVELYQLLKVQSVYFEQDIQHERSRQNVLRAQLLHRLSLQYQGYSSSCFVHTFSF